MKEIETEKMLTGRLHQARTALDDAKFLIAGRRSPQSIVNRSYYAMFYAAVALLETIGKIPSKHAGVISLFDSEFIRSDRLPKALSRDFHRAFELRQLSDYRMLEPCSPEKATQAYERAVRFVDAVAGYIASEFGSE